MSPELIALLSTHNTMLAGGIFVIMTLIKPAFANFFKTHWGSRLLPVAPLVLGIIGSFSGFADAKTWQDKLLIGLLAGFVSGHFFKLGKTTLLGIGCPEVTGDDVGNVGNDDPHQAPALSTVRDSTIVMPSITPVPVAPILSIVPPISTDSTKS